MRIKNILQNSRNIIKKTSTHKLLHIQYIVYPPMVNINNKVRFFLSQKNNIFFIDQRSFVSK